MRGQYKLCRSDRGWVFVVMKGFSTILGTIILLLDVLTTISDKDDNCCGECVESELFGDDICCNEHVKDNFMLETIIVVNVIEQ